MLFKFEAVNMFYWRLRCCLTAVFSVLVESRRLLTGVSVAMASSPQCRQSSYTDSRICEAEVCTMLSMSFSHP